MAYTASNLHNRAGAVGDLTYTYDAGSDTMATVIANGYFLDSNGNNATNLQAEDLIWCQCADGNMWLRVSAASATAVVCQFAGGDLPIRTWATGTAAGDLPMKVGFYEVGTSISTSSRGVLPTPYPGAEVMVLKVDSGTQGFNFDAGASASNVSLDASDGAAGGGTGVTYDGSNRRISLVMEGDWFRVKASSTSRWRIYGMARNASAVSEGASVFMPGT